MKINMKIKNPQFVLATFAMTPMLVFSASCASSKPAAPKSPAAKPAVTAVYYAAPKGSGSDCSLASPCSLTGVRDKVRAASLNMTQDIKVVLRGGSYYLSAPLTLTEKDSGRNGYRVLWTNYTGEKPELIGGAPITGWTLDAGNVYKAKVDANTTFHTLYENGVRAVKARYPNTGYLQSENGSGGIADPTYQEAWLQFKNGEIPNWPDIVGGELNTWGYFDWFNSTISITKFDPTARRISIEKPTKYGFVDPKTMPFKFKQNNYDRFYIQGVKSALDAAGEFYLDKAAGVLYYHPRSTTPIADQTIIAPKMKNVLEFKGSSTNALIRDIQFEGIKVSSSDFTNSFDAWEDSRNPSDRKKNPLVAYIESLEPAANRHANVYLTNARNITLKTMEIAGSGYNGITLDLYCQQIIVFNSQIHDVGYAGVLFNGANHLGTDPRFNRDNLIQNNHIYNIGQTVGHGGGVQIIASGHNFINHNEIHNGNRYGVVIGGSYALSSEANFTTGNHVSYNRAYNLNNDSGDTANYYQFAGGRYNVFDHNLSYESNGLTVNSGIYLDNHSDHVTLSNNIAYDSGRISQNENYQTITLLNNVLFHKADPDTWAAAGLDINQMGRVAMSNPVWPGSPRSYLLNAGRFAVGAFATDGYFDGGKALGNLIPIDTGAVAKPAPQEVYQWARYGPSQYVLPNLLANGTYKVRLHFAELTFKAANQRKFNVAINGVRKLANFDIVGAAGGMGKANVQEFTVKANDEGRIVIS